MELDLSAFDTAPQSAPHPRGAFLSPEDVVDCDGILVPGFWRANVARWETTPIAWRRRRSEEWIQDQAAKAAKAEKPKRPAAKRFSTEYAIAWGKKQGWKLVDRERFDTRTKRHHDCQLGMDAIMSRQDGTLVGIQGAGRYERNDHRDRFDRLGGVQSAKARHIAIFYLEFARDSDRPILEEQWA
jgi:hypothetical protein